MWRLRSPYGLTAGIIGGVAAVVLFAAVWLMAVGARQRSLQLESSTPLSSVSVPYFRRWWPWLAHCSPLMCAPIVTARARGKDTTIRSPGRSISQGMRKPRIPWTVLMRPDRKTNDCRRSFAPIALRRHWSRSARRNPAAVRAPITAHPLRVRRPTSSLQSLLSARQSSRISHTAERNQRPVIRTRSARPRPRPGAYAATRKL